VFKNADKGILSEIYNNRSVNWHCRNSIRFL